MVTFVTVLQVNLVMSILLYIMVLVYLYGVQVTSSQRDHASSQRDHASSQRDHASSHRENPPPQQHNADPLNSLIIQLLQADLTRGRTGSRTRTGTETGAERGAVSGTSSGQQGGSSEPHLSDLQDTLLILPYNLPPPGGDILEDDGKREQWDGEEVLVTSDLLRQHRRFHSPRVLLSDRPPLQPPPLYQTDDFVSGTLSSNRTRKRYQMEDFVSRTSSSNRTRRRRDAEHRSYRGEYSVCDSQSRWVTGRTEAVDDRGTTVTVLPKIRTNAREDIKQYFFETRCQSQRPSKGGCRGIDSKNWNSQCKTTQTFVRALTRVKNGVGWRWIRIDTSCVCALSRKRRRT